jgi:hypothetical protein
MTPIPKLSAWAFPEPAARLAWLRPEFSTLYREIPPGVWVTAFSAAWVIVGGVLGGTRSWPGWGPRPLMDQHFIFRGGAGRPPAWRGPGTRVNDP